MSKKRQEKQKQRQERIRIEKHNSSIRSLFPSFSFYNEHLVDKDLVNIVKKACDSINYNVFFNGRGNFTVFAIDFLKAMKKFGFNHAYTETVEQNSVDENGDIVRNKTGWVARKINKYLATILNCVGLLVVDSQSEKIFDYWPEQGFRLIFTKETIGVVFQRLTKSIHDGKTTYSYSVPMTVDTSSKKLKVRFTKHAIDRIIDRFSAGDDENRSYIRYVSIYEFLLYSKCKLNKGLRYDSTLKQFEPYLQFYFPTELDVFFMYNELDDDPYHLNSLNGDSNAYFDRTTKSVRKPFNVYLNCLGSPCVIGDDNSVTCITCLIPGQYPSPETKLLTRKNVKNIPVQDKIRHNFFGKVVIRTDDFLDAIQFFNDNGMPQVFLGDAINTSHYCNIPQYYPRPIDIPEYTRETM